MNLKYILMALCLSFTALMASAGAEAEEATALNVQLAVSTTGLTTPEEQALAREYQLTAILTRGSHIGDTPGTDYHVTTQVIKLADVLDNRPELADMVYMPSAIPLTDICWTETVDARGIDGFTAGTASTTDPLSIAPVTVRLALTRVADHEAAAGRAAGSEVLHDLHDSERTLVIHPREFAVKGDESTWNLSGDTMFVYVRMTGSAMGEAEPTLRLLEPYLGKIVKPVA